MTTGYVEENWRQKVEGKCKKLFDSALWHYPIHQFIGDIVQKNHFNIAADYEFEYHLILFELYCDLVACYIDDTECDVSEILAAGVLNALPSSEAIMKGHARAHVPDHSTLISEADAVYIFATYNLESFEFLIRSYTVGLKENCFSYMEEKIRKLVMYFSHSPINTYLVAGASEKLYDKAKEFCGRQATILFEEQKKAIEGISKLLANKHLIGLKNTVPASFILAQEIESESMPLMPRNSESWDDFLLQVYHARLSSVLRKEKLQFEKDEPDDVLKPKLLRHLEILHKFLDSPSEHPRRYPFPNCIIKLRKVISDTVSEKL